MEEKTKDKATLVIIRNPFEPWNGREVRQIEAGRTTDEVYKEYTLAPEDMTMMINAQNVKPEQIIRAGDFAVIYPVVAKGGGKKIFGIVAMIALSIYSGGVAAGAWQASSGALSSAIWGAGGWAAMAASMAITFIGGTLINRLWGQKADLGSYNGETDPTYSWDGVETMEGQNNAIALTYGTVMSGGQSIGKFIDVDNDDEYLNWLISAGEGPLTISDIKLNDNSVDYYDNLSIETRDGNNVQNVISGFNNTYSTKSVNYELTTTERIDEVGGNTTQGIKVKIEFPNGLYYANDNGSLGNAWVKIIGEYRLGEDGDWVSFISANQKVMHKDGISIASNAVPDDGTYTYIVKNTGNRTSERYRSGKHYRYRYYYEKNIVITYPDGTQKSYTGYLHNSDATVGDFVFSGSHFQSCEESSNFTVSTTGYQLTAAKSSTIRREFRVDNLTAGTYYVRLKITGRSHEVSNNRASVRCYLTEITSIVYDDFSYPNIALIGIRAKATNQLSGTPSLTFLKTRPSVLVWNSDTEEYEEHDSDNPAWASYDCLHQASYLENPVTGDWDYDVRGIPAKYLMYERFKEWADFCDEKNFKVNIELATVGEMLETINNNIANVGHGRVIRFGTRYGCTFDHAQEPVQMFGMGNIIAGSFSEEFMQTSDRANCVELTYTDKDSNYSRETITIYGDNYNNEREEKTAQATFNGITSYDQAFREGKYQLYSNQYLLRTISFEAAIDAIACTVGDVILVAHDVPKWAKSGRIYATIGNNMLLLPVELDETENQYRIQYRTVKDTLYTSNVTIISNEDGWCKVKLEKGFTEGDAPQANDIFDLAVAEIGSKPFIVKSITRSVEDFQRKIECIEYDERLYNETYDVPEKQYSQSSVTVQEVSNLIAERYTYKDDSGITKYHLNASWERTTTNVTYRVSTSVNGSDYSLLASSVESTSYEADIDSQAAYLKVVTVRGVTQTRGVTAKITRMTSMIKTIKIEGLAAEVVPGVGTSEVNISWQAASSASLKYYLLTIGTSSSNVLNAKYTADLEAGTYTVSVAAVSTDGTVGELSSIEVTVTVLEEESNTTE